MIGSGRRLQQLAALVSSAFDEGEMTQILRFEMDVDFDAIVESEKFGMRVFDLVIWAEKQGRLVELATVLSTNRPYRTDFRQFAEGLARGDASGPVLCSFCPHTKPAVTADKLATVQISGRTTAPAVPEPAAVARDESDVAVPEPPPVLKSALKDDPNEGRFGGLAERDGRELSAVLTETFAESFVFDLIVTSTDGSSLVPPVAFYLHPTYPKMNYHIRRIRDGGHRAIFAEVESYGVFTVGCQVRNAKDEWVPLELNLTKLKGLKAKFKSR